MSDITVLGDNEFTMGFRLAGVRRVVNTNGKNLDETVVLTLNDKSIGILVLNRDDVEKLAIKSRDMIENSVKPVCVVLSKDSASEADLRRKVKKSIGIDVWDK